MPLHPYGSRTVLYMRDDTDGQMRLPGRLGREPALIRNMSSRGKDLLLLKKPGVLRWTAAGIIRRVSAQSL